MARPRKPLAQITRHNTVVEMQNRRRAEEKVQTSADQLQKPPEWLRDEVAIAEWERILPELLEIGFICNVDRNNIGCYCNAFSAYIEATKKLKDEPLVIKKRDGNKAENPLLKVQKLQSEEMSKYANKIGISIDARLRIGASKVQKEQDDIKERFGAI